MSCVGRAISQPRDCKQGVFAMRDRDLGRFSTADLDGIGIDWNVARFGVMGGGAGSLGNSRFGAAVGRVTSRE